MVIAIHSFAAVVEKQFEQTLFKNVLCISPLSLMKSFVFFDHELLN